MSQLQSLLNKVKFITLDNIYNLCKILVIYLITLIIFLTINNKNFRLLYTLIIYLICIYLFNIEYKIAFLYIIIAICCVLTEAIYITFCNETWKYINPDFINIPFYETMVVFQREKVYKLFFN